MGQVLCYTLVQFEQVLTVVHDKERGLETTETARIFSHSRFPRESHSGRENWRWWMFSRTGERASGMLLLTNQFHNSFEYLSLIGLKKYFCAQSQASIHRAAFVIFLYEASFFRESGPNKLSALYLQIIGKNYRFSKKFHSIHLKQDNIAECVIHLVRISKSCVS